MCERECLLAIVHWSAGQYLPDRAFDFGMFHILSLFDTDVEIGVVVHRLKSNLHLRQSHNEP